MKKKDWAISFRSTPRSPALLRSDPLAPNVAPGSLDGGEAKRPSPRRWIVLAVIVLALVPLC